MKKKQSVKKSSRVKKSYIRKSIKKSRRVKNSVKKYRKTKRKGKGLEELEKKLQAISKKDEKMKTLQSKIDIIDSKLGSKKISIDKRMKLKEQKKDYEYQQMLVSGRAPEPIGISDVMDTKAYRESKRKGLNEKEAIALGVKEVFNIMENKSRKTKMQPLNDLVPSIKIQPPNQYSDFSPHIIKMQEEARRALALNPVIQKSAFLSTSK